MAKFNENGKWYRKYIDPKTSAKEKAKLYAKFGKRYGWPRNPTSTGSGTGGGGTTTPPLTTSEQIDQSTNQNTGVDTAGQATDVNDWYALLKKIYPKDEDAKAAYNQILLGMGMITPKQLEDTYSSNFANYLSQAKDMAATEDPRMVEMYNRFLAQSQGNTPEEIALREELSSNMQGDLQSGLRQANLAGAGRGISGPANQILYEPFMRDFADSSRGMQRDVVARRDSMADRATNAASWLGTDRLNRFNNMVNLASGMRTYDTAFQQANNDNLDNYQMFLYSVAHGGAGRRAADRYNERAMDISQLMAENAGKIPRSEERRCRE